MNWLQGNAGKRADILRRYESKPESETKKRERTRKATLARYGLVESDYQAMLLRQRDCCAGCGEHFGGTTPVIDHHHETGRVRGLLCHHCNWAVGHAREDRARLYQLAAYLELDRTSPVVYLIGSLRNENVVVLGNELRGLGLEVIDNWVAAGKIADDSWRDYSLARGRNYKEALESREAEHIFNFDLAYLNLSDAVVMLMPAGKSAHLEFGYAVGQRKLGFILMEDQPERLDIMTKFSYQIFHERPALFQALKQALL